MAPENKKKKPVFFISKDKRTTLITGIFITVFFLGIFIQRPAIITYLDQKIYDVMHQNLEDEGFSRAVVVDIDDKSLEKMGQWPWSRRLLAELFSRIASADPRAVGVDVLLSEPDRTSIVRTLDQLKDTPNLNAPVQAIRETLPPLRLDNDLSLVRALQTGPFILACKFLPDQTTGMPPNLLPLNVSTLTTADDMSVFSHFPHWRGILSALPQFLQATPGSGFVNALSDNDGIVRRTPFITAYKGKFYPSLSLATLMHAVNADRVLLGITPGGLESVSFKGVTVPVSSRGNLLLNFHRATPAFTTLSAADLMDGTIAPSTVHDKIVYVGASASGLGDHHDTPLQPFFYGVGIHATATDNVLNKNTLSRPDWVPGVEWMLVLVTGLFSTLLLMYLPPWPCALLLMTAATLLWLLEGMLLQEKHLYISVTYPLLTLFFTLSLLSLIRFRMEEKKRLRRTRDMVQAQNLTLVGITSLAATRDKETGMHIRRTATFVKLLAQRLRRSPQFKERLDDHTIEVMYKSAPMHDIGKVGIPDAVLLKPGKLTESEFKEIQKHTDLGWQAIDEAEKASGVDGDTSFLNVSKEICRSHHEKWDGSGYNQGLSGEEIPLSARIMAVADVYDALTSKRVYKASFDHTKARNIIVEGRGNHFDPDVVDAFLEEQERFQQIAVEMADE